MSWCGFAFVGFAGSSPASWIWMSVSLPRLGKFLAIISSDKIFCPLFSLFFWDSYNRNVIMLDVVAEVPKSILVLHNSFSLLFTFIIFPLVCSVINSFLCFFQSPFHYMKPVFNLIYGILHL